jgi:tRNA threonylcarbamoyladenosine biosynthesis protein TsaB
LKILAFDSSNQPLSVAVTDNKQLLAEQTINVKRNHSIQLMPAIEEALKQAEITLAEIDRIAVAAGPGSYTGIRIAATIAKSLAWAEDIELVGLSSLKTLAANSFHPENIVPLFDARRENIYTGLYTRNEAGEIVQKAPDTHISAKQWAEYLAAQPGEFELIGEDTAAFFETFQEQLGDRVHLAQPTQNAPRASALALLGEMEAPIKVHEFTPTYLKLAEAEENWLEENPDYEGDDWVEKV